LRVGIHVVAISAILVYVSPFVFHFFSKY